MFEFLKKLFTKKPCTCCNVVDVKQETIEQNIIKEEIVIEQYVETPKPKLVKKIKVEKTENQQDTKTKKKKKKKIVKKDDKK